MRRGNQSLSIGVFDSGLGGLTVVKELMRQLPCESITYLGDTARVPYGTKSKKSIIRFSMENATILLKHRVKMIVVACNSCSSYAINILKKYTRIPVVGVIRPGAQRALCVTATKKIGVIATAATIRSGAYTKEIHRQDSTARVLEIACPLFVPLVEEGWFHRPETLSIAQGYLKSIKADQSDTLILGCTHYPLLKTTLKKVMGPKVKLIDSAQEVVRKVKDILLDQGLDNKGKQSGDYKFLVTDEPANFERLAKRLLKIEVNCHLIKM